MNTIKVCPFCGNEPVKMAVRFGREKENRYFIQCETCHFNLGPSDSEKEAIERWNTRAEVTDGHTP